MKTKYLWFAIFLGFAVTLAVVVGQRLSAEAMAVVVGVVAGVAASIPTSLIVVWVATRNGPARAEESHRRAAPPSVVVVQSPAPPVQPMMPAGSYLPALGYGGALYPARQERSFNVLGGTEIDD